LSFPRYPAYQPSGVEWLGEVPKHWEVISIKWLSPVKRGASPRPIDDPKYFDDEGEFAWVRIADVSACDGVLNETTQRLSELGSSLSVKIAPGELFVSIAGTVGKPCISAIKACIHDGFVYFPSLKINPLFLYRIFEGGTCYGGLGKWGTQLNLNTDTIGSIRVAVPPADELKQLLSFLDRETGKIDALVAEQRRLMELLKEKRQAVISHAVTRGLNPAAPLKPSGIEWIGDVPEHWDVMPLKRACRIESGHTPQKSNEAYWVQEDCCIPWISLNDTKTLSASDFIDETEVQISAVGMQNSSAHLIEAGAVVMNRDGARVGLSAITTKPMCVSQHIIAWVCGPSVFNQYLLHVLYAMNDEIYRLAGGATIPTIGMPDIREMTMPLPPLSEQKAIVAHLLDQRQRLDTLTAEAQRAIDLLQERRTALISAAVTGQIDVRSAVAAS
jgi:type I restriction enzyme S subunit